MKLILATQNKDKIVEFNNLVTSNNLKFEVKSLKDYDITYDVEENGATLKENSYLKAKGYKDIIDSLGIDDYIILADDSGLFVDSLDGEPGIYSARYSGVDATYAKNRAKLLSRLGDNPNRNAHFKTIICLLEKDLVHYFEGQVDGSILYKETGTLSQFGYDSIFYSFDLKKSFGESTREEKNSVSHRGRAFNKLLEYLRSK